MRRDHDGKKEQVVESTSDRLALAHDAGLGAVSVVSVLAGTLVAYGAFAVIVGIVGGIAAAAGADVGGAGSARWDLTDMAGAAVAVFSLFLAYLFGGYVAGRMARRAGLANGLAVFVVGILLAGAAAVVVGFLTDADGLRDNLESVGVPATADGFEQLATFAGVAALLAMGAGGLIGGMLGERWHARLLTRALDPNLGREAEAERKADERSREAEQRRREAVADHQRTLAEAEARRQQAEGRVDQAAAGSYTHPAHGQQRSDD